MKFYICKHCGNIITKLTDKVVPVMCCGEKMQELVAGTTDAAVEKHVPVVTVSEGKVNVVIGEVEHPMTPEHFIEWVVVETNLGEKIKHLEPNQKPQAEFAILADETVLNVYAYCNLHSLWKA